MYAYLTRNRLSSTRSLRDRSRLSGPADDFVPLTGPALQQYAAAHTAKEVHDYVLSETGIDTNAYVKNGTVDWNAVASATSAYYLGIDVGGFINSDGSINWRSAAADAGGAAAAAFCTAYGLGAVASMCSSFGGSIAGALYDVGADFIKFFTGSATPPSPANAAEMQLAVLSWLRSPAGSAQRNRLARLLALRAMAITSYQVLVRLQAAWNKGTGQRASLQDIQTKLATHGWLWSPAFNHVGGKSIYSTSANWTVFQLANTVFGVQGSGSLTDFDRNLGIFTTDRWDVYPVESVLRRGGGSPIVEVIPGSPAFGLTSSTAAVAYSAGQASNTFGTFDGSVYVLHDAALVQWLDSMDKLLIFDAYRQAWADSLEKATRAVIRDIAAVKKQPGIVKAQFGPTQIAQFSNTVAVAIIQRLLNMATWVAGPVTLSGQTDPHGPFSTFTLTYRGASYTTLPFQPQPGFFVLADRKLQNLSGAAPDPWSGDVQVIVTDDPAKVVALSSGSYANLFPPLPEVSGPKGKGGGGSDSGTIILVGLGIAAAIALALSKKN
jgi:hypothetical protein